MGAEAALRTAAVIDQPRAGFSPHWPCQALPARGKTDVEICEDAGQEGKARQQDPTSRNLTL